MRCPKKTFILSAMFTKKCLHITILVFEIILSLASAHNMSVQPGEFQSKITIGRNLTNWSRRMGPLKPLDAVWQRVAGTRHGFYVYSAYFDQRRSMQPVVRVIAAANRLAPDRVFCRLILPDKCTYNLKAIVQTVGENHKLYSSATIVLCPMNLAGVSPEDLVGAAVSVVAMAAANRPATNLLQLIYLKPKFTGEENVHVCVRPFYASYDNIEWMVEWLELNRMLGVSHFYVYNMSLGDRLNCLLNYYTQRRFVSDIYRLHGAKDKLFTILSWNLPLDLWAEGQLAAINDCLYRSISKADWLLMIDVDELVLPHGQEMNMTLSESLRQPLPSFHTILNTWTFKNLHGSSPSAYLFRNAFFYTGWEDDPKSPVPLLTSSRKTQRTRSLNSNERKKYIVRTKRAVELGIHDIHEFLYGRTVVNVDEDQALLHHYRVECVVRGCLGVQWIRDRTAHLWARWLWRRVKRKWDVLSQVCNRVRNINANVTEVAPLFL